MVTSDDPRVKKLLSFKSVTREDLAVLVVTGTERGDQLERERDSRLTKEQVAEWLNARAEKLTDAAYGMPDAQYSRRMAKADGLRDAAIQFLAAFEENSTDQPSDVGEVE